MARAHQLKGSGAPERARAGTKQAVLVGMLSRDGGASIREIVEATGWQANTVHSALTTLRKGGRQISVEQMGAGSNEAG